MIRRTLHVSWMTVLALLALLGALFYYLGWTESGLRSIAGLLSRRIGPVSMQIEAVSGTLAGGAHIGHFRLEHRRAQIEADQVDLRLAMWPLLWQSIRIEQAQIASFRLHVLPREEDNSSWRPHFLPRLLTVTVDSARVGTARLVTTRERTYEASELSASGVVHATSIRVFDARMLYSEINVHGTGVISAAQPIGIRGDLRLDSHPQGQPLYTGHASLNGNLDRLPITGEITAPFSADFRGAAEELNADWHWSGDSQVRRLDLTAWDLGDALGVITGRLHLTGNAEGFRADGSLLPPGLDAGPLQVSFDGNYADKELLVRKLNFLHAPSGTLLGAHGTIGVQSGGPRLALSGEWHTLRWPLARDDAPVHSEAGTYALRGLRPYQLEAQGELTVKDLPSMQFSGRGLLQTDRLEVEQSAFEAFGGHAELTGTAWWRPDERWQAHGHMQDLSIASLRAGIAGRLNFDFKASGTGFGADSAIENSFSNLSGNVRGQPASGRAHVTSAGEDWLLDDVRVQLGATRIEARGRMGASPDLDFTLEADDLALFEPQARGRLSARGSVRTSGAAPRVQLQASGHDLAWGDWGAASLELHADLDPLGSGAFDSQLRLGDARLGGRSLQQLDLRTDGRAAAHSVALTLRAPRLELTAGGKASYQDGRWDWHIEELATDDQRKLRMQLESPGELVLGASVQQLQRLCLRQASARLCLEGRSDAGERHFAVQAEQMPMSTLTAGLSTSTEFSGTAALQLEASRVAGAEWHGQLRAELDSAAARHQLRSGQFENFSIGSGSVNADLDGGGLRARFALDAGTAGHLSGNLLASNAAAQMRDWPLRGDLQLESDALSVLDSYITEVDRITGRVAANLAVSGTVGQPAFSGALKVSGGEVDAYQINLALRDLAFNANLQNNRLSLDGSMAAGVGGTAQFKGEVEWRDRLPYGVLSLTGKDMWVVNVPEARVQVSPDVRLRLNGRRIDIDGRINLPYARLEPAQFTDAVLPSSDEVIVNEPRPTPEEQFQVYSDVTLALGDRVTINTLGLSGRLSGTLSIRTDESGISRGSGELKVEEGKYTYYARKLDIERGKLDFDNAPLSNPALDLRATKRFPDITAGVNVRGTLVQPVLTFFSEPAVSQSQIVSLLLAGGSLESVQNSSDPTARSNAARSNMLLQGSAILAAQTGLSTKLGIEDVSVESDLNNDTSLVLGRYLSPRLYLSYGIGIAEAINTLKLRYTIGDHWTLRTESGQARSADLLYSIEK